VPPLFGIIEKGNTMSEDSQKEIIKGFQIPYPEFGIVPKVIIKGDAIKVPGTEVNPSITIVNEGDKTE
jgi:hypothetical protein